MTQAELYSDYGAGAAVLAPLGLCYLASFLEKEGHTIKIIDGVAEKTSQNELKQRILEFNPDIIGITAMTVAYNRAVETAKFIKEFKPDSVLLLGGPHISSVPIKTFQEHDCFDIGVTGEGELTMKELTEYLEKRKFKNYKKDLKDIKGIIFRDDAGDIILMPRRELIKDLDSLPLPARHLLPDIELYNSLPIGGQKPNVASIIPSRGCPFQCVFCDQNVFGHKWRSFSAEYVIKEVEELVNKYGVNTIQIQDDLFTLKRDRVIRFCNLLLEKNIKIIWNLSSRVDSIDEEIAKLMKKVGCDIVYFGIESGDQEVLNKIKKKITLEQVIKTVKMIKKVGLRPSGSFIIGLPFDTKETIEKTIRFALSLPLDAVSFHIATPYPNTEFESIAANYGTLYTPDWSQYRGHPDEVMYTPEGISKEYLLNKQKEAYRRFYLRPRLIFTKILEIRDPRTFFNYIKGAFAVIRP